MRVLEAERLHVVEHGPAAERAGDGDQRCRQHEHSPPPISELPQLPHLPDPMRGSGKLASGLAGVGDAEPRGGSSAK